jgi:hypothetical protein
MMSDSRQPRDDKNSVGNEGTEVIIKDNAADPQAALPPGALKGPFLERQGDEQRQPSKTSGANWPKFEPGNGVREKIKPGNLMLNAVVLTVPPRAMIRFSTLPWPFH